MNQPESSQPEPSASSRPQSFGDHNHGSARTSERNVTEPRPNPAAAYHCGLNSIGRSCALGPTPSGRCCQEHWIVKCDSQACATKCTGAEKCEIGQLKHAGCEVDKQDYLPCIPIKNSWYSRNNLSVNLAILVSGILLVCMALPNNESILAPGALSKSHSQILGKTTGVARCSTCHPNSHVQSSGLTQEQLCMNCHNSHMKDAIHGYPHDLTAMQFSRLMLMRESTHTEEGKSFKSKDLATLETSGSHWRGIHTACAQCHQEHHGDSRSLKTISDARCQSCHQQQFTSFSHGHPEFRQLPFSRQRRIAFDHVAHLEKHFPQSNSVLNCSDCHQPDANPDSTVLRSVSFQKACAGCHDKPLRASIAEGWAVLQLPSLQASDTKSGGTNFVDWPIDARYGYDGPITLPMRMLLSSEPIVADAINLFPEGDLSRTQPDNPTQQEAARTIATAVRQLLLETAEQGQAAWQRRLIELATKALGREPNETEQELIKSMVSGLPPDLFRQVDSQWFNGPTGVVHHSSSRPSAVLVSLTENYQDDNLLDESDGTLLDLSSKDLLDAEDIDELLRGSSTGEQPKTPGFAPELDSTPSMKDPSIPTTRPDSSELKQLVGVRHLEQGGWFLDDRLYAIRYMPRGHADPVVASWIQFAALVDSQVNSGSNRTSDKQGIHPLAWHPLDWTSGSPSVRQCLECHLLPNAKEPIVSSDDWKSLQHEPGRRFTRFDHRPHMTLAAGADCQTCHRLNKSREQPYASVRQQSEWTTTSDRLNYNQKAAVYFRDEFHPIQKADCNTCHRPGGAAEGCTQCHNYHVDTITLE